MRVLYCDPEASGQRGGLSIAVRCLVEALQDTSLQLWQLHQQSGSYAANCPGQPSHQAPSLELMLSVLQPDLMVAVGWHTWSEAAALLARQRSVPTIFWSHGVGCFNWYSARPLLGALRWCWRAPRFFSVVRALQQVNHLVVAYSRSATLDPRSMDELLARRWLRKPVTVIGNPVDTSFWRPLHDPQRDSSTVVSVGRLEWQKGHASAFRIVLAARLRHQCLHCIAPEGSSYGQQLMRRACSSGQGDCLQISLGMSAKQRLDQLQRALCLVSWSETEYQSLAMLEALACACPVIARPRGWLRHHQIPGVLIANSRSQATDWLDALAADPAWASRIGREGRAYVEQCHSFAVVSQQWRRLFHQILKQR